MCPKWTWTADEPLPELQPGDDIEVMFHGGSTARGNLYLLVRNHPLMAWRLHGKVKFSDLDVRRRLEWVEEPKAA